jgi:FHA domain
MGYSTVPWASFGAALAAVAGALTGLLFVALSVKSDTLLASRSLRGRATQTLVLFMTSVLIAVCLVAPQPAAALGAELIAVAVASGTLLLILDRRAGHGSNLEVARDIERFAPNALTTALVGVAGLTLLVKAGGGLYWLIPAAVASLAGGVVSAWLFLVGLTGQSGTSEFAMPPDQHVNPAEEPASTSSPGRPADPAAEGITLMPGVLREPASRIRIQPQVMRIGRRPDNDIIVSDLGVPKQHTELRRTPAGRYSIIDVGSHTGTFVNGTPVTQQELKEGDIIAIGHATFRLVGGELIEYVDDGRSPR